MVKLLTLQFSQSSKTKKIFKKMFLKSFYAFTYIFFSVQIVCAQKYVSKIFENGNTICLLGDSITHGGQFHEFLQLYYATRYPNLKLTFINCGIAGDNAEGMIYRLDKDVLIHKPSHVFLMTGMNDVIRTLYFEGKASDEIIEKRKIALFEYKKNTDVLAEKFEASGISPIYLTPSIYDQYSKIEKENDLGCNDALIECSDHIKSIAYQYDATVVDLNTPMKNIMERELQNDSLFTIVGKDRVHPETTGHFIMFYEILSTIESPSLVAQISIDLHQKPSVQTKNCVVEKFQISNETITFNCLENSLPFPINEALEKAISLVPFQNNFNKEILQIKGLKEGEYDLFIQEKLINTFSSKELNEGVNLSNQLNSPQLQQAKKITKLCKEYRKTGYQLRAVPLIEFKYLRDYSGANNLLGKQKHLEKKLKIIEGKPFYNYIKRSIDVYFETLPKQDSLKNRLQLIENSIYEENKPTQLKWRLVKNMKQSSYQKM